MSKYPMSHVLLERKCRDTSVRITLVWVTGDTHPPVGTFMYMNVHIWFCSVSLVDLLSGHFIVQSQRPDEFFLSTLLIFLSSLDIRE